MSDVMASLYLSLESFDMTMLFGFLSLFGKIILYYIILYYYIIYLYMVWKFDNN